MKRVVNRFFIVFKGLKNQIEIDVAEGSTIAQIIEPFGLPEKLVHLVLVNGVYVAPAERLSFVPKNADVLAIWPPIAGG